MSSSNPLFPWYPLILFWPEGIFSFSKFSAVPVIWHLPSMSLLRAFVIHSLIACLTYLFLCTHFISTPNTFIEGTNHISYFKKISFIASSAVPCTQEFLNKISYLISFLFLFCFRQGITVILWLSLSKLLVLIIISSTFHFFLTAVSQA